VVSILVDAFADSVQQLVDGALCSGLDPVSILLAAAPPAPQFLQDNPYFGGLLRPTSCATPIPAPTPGFTGGQCPGVLYRVFVEVDMPDGSVLAYNTPNNPGPVKGIQVYWRDYPDIFNPGLYPFVRLFAEFTDPPGYNDFGPLSQLDNNLITFARIVDIQGSPNNCGDAPRQPLLPATPSFPLPPISVPPITVNLPGFPGISIGGTVSLSPIINLPRLGGLHIPALVTINANAEVNIPVTFPVYIQLPSLRINNLISFNPRFDVTPEIDIDLPGGGGGTGGCDCEDIREIVIEELDNKFRPRRPNSNQTTGYASAQSRVITLPDYTYRVDLTIDSKPVNAKTQWGVDAPDIYYAGWYSFGGDGKQGDRKPVAWENGSYFPPEGAKTFTYTLQEGYTGTVSVLWKQES
jgi:hypothetical protein